MYRPSIFLLLPLIWGCSSKTPQVAPPDDDSTSGSLKPFTVSAGPDQVVPEKTQIVLGGQVEGSSGDSFFYAWEQLPGPEGAVELTNRNRPNAFFLAPSVLEPVALEFKLTVTSGAGVASSDIVEVLVNPVNEAPEIFLQEEYVFLESDDVLVLANVSDSDGAIERYKWSQTAGIEIQIAASDSQNLRFVPPDISVPKTLKFNLVVEDNEGGISERATSIVLNPLLIFPTVSIESPAKVTSFDPVALVASSRDEDGEIVEKKWIQLSGPPVQAGPQVGDDDFHFIAPDVSVATELEFSYSVTDNDALTSQDSVTILVEPQQELNLLGYVAYGPDLNIAGIEARRVVDGVVIPALVTPAALAEGPLGEFELSLPGVGRYELTARMVLEADENVDSAQVMLKAVIDVVDDHSIAHVNVLTHLASNFSIQDKDSANAQVESNLEPFLGLSDNEPEKLHVFGVSDRKGSAYLATATALLMQYSKSISTTKMSQKNLAGFFELLPYQIGNMFSENHFKQGMRYVAKTLDPVAVNAKYRDSIEGEEQSPVLNINEVFDLDLDGLANLVDSDDDGDGVPDTIDATPFGYRFLKPLCHVDEVEDILVTPHSIFNLASRWMPEQYLNVRFDKLQASPLISPLEKEGRWKVTRLSEDPLIVRFALNDSGNVLFATIEQGLDIGPSSAVAENRDEWLVESAYPGTSTRIYHIRNKASPNLYLSNQIQSSGLDKLNEVYLDPQHQGVKWASQWGFCISEEQYFLDDYAVASAPEDFMYNGCSNFEYQIPSFLETKSYFIQNASSLDQYLNRVDGLRNSSLISGEDLGGQWQFIGLPLSSEFLIKSAVDDALYLSVDAENEIFLEYVPDVSFPGDQIKWTLDSLDSFKTTRRIRNVKSDLFLAKDNSGSGVFTVTNDVKMLEFNQFDQSWRFCEVTP